MKNVVSFIKKTLYNTSAIYLFISCVIFVIFFGFSNLDPKSSGAMNLQIYSLLFSFLTALVISVCGLFDKMMPALKRIIEFVFSYVFFYYCFFAMTGNGKNFTAIFALSTAYVLVYAIILVVSTLHEKLLMGKEEYKNVYSETKSDK